VGSHTVHASQIALQKRMREHKDGHGRPARWARRARTSSQRKSTSESASLAETAMQRREEAGDAPVLASTSSTLPTSTQESASLKSLRSRALELRRSVPMRGEIGGWLVEGMRTERPHRQLWTVDVDVEVDVIKPRPNERSLAGLLNHLLARSVDFAGSHGGGCIGSIRAGGSWGAAQQRR
jgi:hypothetical protein